MEPGSVTTSPLVALLTPPEEARIHTSVACCDTGNLRQVIALPGCGDTGRPVCAGNWDTSHGGIPLVTAPFASTMADAGSVVSGRHCPPSQAALLLHGSPSRSPPTQRWRRTTSNTTGVPSSTALPCASTTNALSVVSNVPSLLSTKRGLRLTRILATGPAETATNGCCSTRATARPSDTVSAHAETVTEPGWLPARSCTIAKPAVSLTANGASIGQSVFGSGIEGVASDGGKITAPAALWAATTRKYTRTPDNGWPLLSNTRA